MDELLGRFFLEFTFYHAPPMTYFTLEREKKERKNNNNDRNDRENRDDDGSIYFINELSNIDIRFIDKTFLPSMNSPRYLIDYVISILALLKRR